MTDHNVLVSAYSDLDRDPRRRRLWGDFWFKERLVRALRRQGVRVSDRTPQAWIHLFGHPMDPPAPVREGRGPAILWVHSHPDNLTPAILGSATRVLSASPGFANRLRQKGIAAEWLMTPTHMRRLNVPREFDIVFVGNTRRPRPRGSSLPVRPVIRPVIGHLLHIRARLPKGIRVGIWGHGWEGLVPEQWLRGEAVDPGRLNTVYSSARIVLNDHHGDMAREGFVNPRVLDALAAGARVISDPVRDLEDLFGDRVAIYRTPDDVGRHIGEILGFQGVHEELRAREGSAAARRFSYTGAASRLKALLAELLSG